MIKTVRVYFPLDGEKRELMFSHDAQAVDVLCAFLAESGGLITGLAGFEEKEIRLLKSARSALGDPLFVSDCDG